MVDNAAPPHKEVFSEQPTTRKMSENPVETQQDAVKCPSLSKFNAYFKSVPSSKCKEDPFSLHQALFIYTYTPVIMTGEMAQTEIKPGTFNFFFAEAESTETGSTFCANEVTKQNKQKRASIHCLLILIFSEHSTVGLLRAIRYTTLLHIYE